jgi:hypothetical protein
MAESDHQARFGDEAGDQVAWCVALQDSLPTGAGDSADAPPDQSTEYGPDAELDQFIELNETAHTRHDAEPPPLSSLDVLRAPLGAEEDFIALIETANGQDDHHDPTDDRIVEAMEILLEDDVLEPSDAPPARVDGRVRNELWTHMLWGYRVGRYLLMTKRRSSLSFDSSSASYASSELISCVRQSSGRQDVADAITSSDLGAALHYHAVSSTLRRVCGGDKAQARALVTRTENLGFLTALGAEDLTQGLPLDVDEAGSEAVGASVGTTADANAGRRTRRSVGRDG